MEITAVIEGLLLLPTSSTVQVFTTSDYLFQGATQWIHGWRKRNWQKKDGQDVANADLWQALDQLSGKYKIRWVNAKGQDMAALQEAAALAAEAAHII
jgi:ribonuclease HI